MSFYDFLFFSATAITVLGAVGVVVFGNVLYAAFSLFLSLAGVAVVFGLIGADFLMAVQFIVYVGGVLVLILFGILLTARIYEVKWKDDVFRPSVGLVLGGCVFLLLGAVVFYSALPVGKTLQEVGSTADSLGDLLLGKYLLVFEILSVLLLAAAVGAAVLVRREIKGEEEA